MKIHPFRRVLRTILLLSVLALIGACTQREKTVYDLRCENLTDPLSVDQTRPHLSWKMKSKENGNGQSAYQILAATHPSLLKEGKADLWDSGKILSPESVMVSYGSALPAGCRLVYWKVRVWDRQDKASGWSETARFGTALSGKDLAAAAYIGFPAGAGNPQSPLLRKTFEGKGLGETRLLYVNSLGYHEVYLNGKKIGDQVLAPAVSQLNKRSLYCTYDQTPYLQKGSNDLALWLGQGWYRPGMPGIVYEGPLAKVLMETYEGGTWRNALVSDSSWQAAQSGYTSLGSWMPGQFWGERLEGAAIPADLSGASLDRLSWHPAACVEVPAHAVSPQMTEGNCIAEIIKPSGLKKLADSVWLVDMGEVLTGWFEIRFPPLEKGQEIVLQYSDLMEKNGKIYDQHQEDRYIASGQGAETFREKFNYHGFQYVRISGLYAEPSLEAMSGRAIRTAFREGASFECSDADMNAIHDLIQRTLKNLSLGGYLVDCTQLERLGYGGDGNASTQTAQTMFDLSPLYANWMRAWGDVGRENGDLPHTAPSPYWAGGGPYWCGFLITASWRTYINYGDRRLIENYYPQMQRWLGFVEAHMPDGLLRPWPVEIGFRNWYLGDWACPKDVDPRIPESIDLVNNSFISICYQTMEKIARTLGREEDIAGYAAKNAALQQRIQQAFYDETKGSYASGSQIDLAFPLLAGVTLAPLAEKVTESLWKETDAHGGHIACGLVGIPTIVEWAVTNHQPDFIYTMLKKRSYPGYLYMIDNGATGTWEHWEGSRSRSHNCYNGIGSWFYEALGGIRPDEGAAGYRRIRIAPQIPEGVTWAKVTKETPYGPAAIDWKLTGNDLEMAITLPPGSEGVVELPAGTKEYRLDGKVVNEPGDAVVIGSGKYQVRYAIR